MNNDGRNDTGGNKNNENESNDFDREDEETVIRRTFQLLESLSVTPLQLERLHEKKLITLRKRVPKPDRVGAPDHVASPIWSKCHFMQPSVTEEGLEAYTSLGASAESILHGIHKIISKCYLVVCVACMGDPNKPLKDCLIAVGKTFCTTLTYLHLDRVHKDIKESVQRERSVFAKRFNRWKNKKRVLPTSSNATGDATTALAVTSSPGPVLGDSDDRNDGANQNNEDNNSDLESEHEETVIERTFQFLELTCSTPLQLERLREKKLITLRKRIPKPERVGEKDHVASPLWSKCIFMQPSVTEEGLEAYTSLGACEQNMFRGIDRIVSNFSLVVCVTCMKDPNKPLKDCLITTGKRWQTTHCYKHLERVHKDLGVSVRRIRSVMSSRCNQNNKSTDNATAAATPGGASASPGRAVGDNAATAPALRDNDAPVIAAVGDYDDGGDDAGTKRQKVSRKKGSAIRLNDTCAFRAAARKMVSTLARAQADRSRVALPSMMTEILGRTNKLVAVLKHHFEGAMNISEVWNVVVQPVATKYGITATNTCFAQSICDENVMMVINNNNQQQKGTTTTIADRFIQYLGPEQEQRQQVFPLGGLAGIPFEGSTGFKIFSRHVPTTSSTETGAGGCHHAFVLQASHIGLASDGTLGTHTHSNNSNGGGLDDSSSSTNVACCEAATKAFARCCAASPPLESEHDNDNDAQDDDIQMAFLRREIRKRANLIIASTGDDDNDCFAELARQTYKIGKTMLNKIINTDFGDKESMLFVLTGIQINMPEEFEEDYFQPKSFVIYKKDGSIVNLLA